MYKRILVSTDGSELSQKAIRAAIEIGAVFNSEVHVLHVINPRIAGSTIVDPEYGVVEPTSELWIRMLEKEGEEMLASARDIAAKNNGSITTYTRIGDPRDEILDLVEDIGADLLVMGSTGKGMGRRIILGSISSSVVEHSKIATLIIK